MRLLGKIFVGTLLCSLAAMGQDPSTYSIERKKAMDLFNAQNMKDALPLLEKLAAENPADVVVQERLGMAAWVSSSDIADPAKRKAECFKARNAFLKAKELGDNSPLLQSMLPAIPENCEDRGFSSKKEIDDIMRAAEGAYARADFDTAIQGYEKALQLDPKYYTAALYEGDVYFKQEKHDKAAEYFARAIAINPNIETAYRYWGDDLMAQGRIADARDKFIDAFIVWPYDQRSWLALQAWAQRVKVKLNTVQIKSPNAVDVKADGNANITIDSSKLDKDDGGAAWLAYDMGRVLWRNQKFAEKFPGQKYRHTLVEEVDCLSTAASVVEESSKKRSARLQEQLIVLLDLKKKGLIEPYVLISAADQDLAKDYEAYRDKNRDKLREYLSTYIVPPAPAQ